MRSIERSWRTTGLAALAGVLALAASVRGAEPKPLPQAWDYAAAMTKIAAKGKQAKPGVVLHVGDSITYANPYGQWARGGAGKSDEDQAILKWMHAGANDDTDGWHLAAFDHADGGRSYTACGGITLREMFDGGKQNMPPLAKILDTYKPQAVVLMLGTNDASQRREVKVYAKDLDEAIRLMLDRGIVPILSTIPPHVGQPELAKQINGAIRAAAQRNKLPLIDFEREIIARRPNDWNGTLMGKDDVHPASANGVAASAAPTEENLRSNGYLLRGWLSVKKVAEVRRAVFEAR
jgi:lysophospholipase L1-like esterase